MLSCCPARNVKILLSREARQDFHYHIGMVGIFAPFVAVPILVIEQNPTAALGNLARAVSHDFDLVPLDGS